MCRLCATQWVLGAACLLSFPTSDLTLAFPSLNPVNDASPFLQQSLTEPYPAMRGKIVGVLCFYCGASWLHCPRQDRGSPFLAREVGGWEKETVRCDGSWKGMVHPIGFFALGFANSSCRQGHGPMRPSQSKRELPSFATSSRHCQVPRVSEYPGPIAYLTGARQVCRAANGFP